MGALVSLGLIGFGQLSFDFTQAIKQHLAMLDFPKFILGILLSFLLFAGSLHIKFRELMSFGKSIFLFATLGTLLSTFLIGSGVYYLLTIFDITGSFISCLLFGALISPTDPIAVISILKSANLSKSTEIRIFGESLFNDGIGVVIFATLFEVSTKGANQLNVPSVAFLFAKEALGGIAAGLAIGYLGYRMMKSIDQFQTEILISLAMVMGGYTLCSILHVSGPLAMVIAGLFTGNKGKAEAMSNITRDYLEKFWEVTDHLLNAILFMLIGLEIVIVHFNSASILIGLIASFLLLLVRYISLFIPSKVFLMSGNMEL